MKYSAIVSKSIVSLQSSSSMPHRRYYLLLVSCAAGLICLSLWQTAYAVDPAPDGGYANDNTAEGENALFDTDINSSTDNTAIGFDVLHFADIIFGDTAVGSQAMEFGGGNFNVAIGFEALFQNSGNDNTAIGASASGLNGTGNNNTAVGNGALFFNDSGSSNTSVGANSLANNTGSSNIAVGDLAGSNLTNGSNNIEIGHEGNSGETNTIRIGKKGVQTKTVIAGIRGTTVSGGITVMIDVNGRLGTTTSSKRYKEAIKPMDKASEEILNLKPVSFRYKKELDPAGIPQFGLVAEQVEKIDPDLVVRDDEGKPYSVRYDAVNAMLLNEFLKEHRKGKEQARKNDEQEKTISAQQKQIAALTAAVKEQAAQIQKISSKLDAARLTPTLVVQSP